MRPLEPFPSAVGDESFRSEASPSAGESLKLRPDEMRRLTPAAFRSAPKRPLVLLLDNIRSAYNVGSLFRTADAFRLQALLLGGITPCPPSTLIRKTAIGAEEVLSWRHLARSVDAVLELRRRGALILSLELTHGAVPLQDFTPPAARPIVLILGNEVHGVSEDLLRHSDRCLLIPQSGTKHSLNVASAAAIAVWHLSRFLPLE